MSDPGATGGPERQKSPGTGSPPADESLGARLSTRLRWWMEHALARRAGPGVTTRQDHVDGLPWVSRRPSGPGVPGAAAVVLVHGLGTSGASLVRLLKCLAPDFDVWAPDLPGFGASGRPGRPLGMAELADGLVAWMDAVGIEQAAAVGHSMGCQVVGQVITRHPGRITRVVLVGPTLDPSARSVHRQAWRLALDAVREPSSQLPWVVLDYLRCGPVRMWRTLRDGLAIPVERRLPHVDVPVLVVCGEHDRVAPGAWMDRMVALLPDARAAVVPDGAHGVTYSHPAEVTRIIAPFLAAPVTGRTV